MDIRDLEVFLSVARHLNFTRAGEEVHLSQPSVSVRVRQLEEGLIRNEYDIGFVGGHLVGDEVKLMPWRSDEVVLVASPDHSLAKRRQVQLKDVARQQFISRETGSATQVAV